MDSSGHAGQPPIIMVATKTTTKGQSYQVLELDDSSHSTYVNCTDNWREKLSAALMFRAILPIFGPQHSIIADWDFNIKLRRLRVQGYLQKLFGRKFYGRPDLNNPSISFANNKNPYVKIADTKAYMAHRKRMARTRAPNLMEDILFL